MRHLYFTLFALIISFSFPKAYGQVGAITGTFSMCSGNSYYFSDTTAPGTWSSSNPAVASCGSSAGNIISANSAGTAIISYTATAGGTVIQVVTVNATTSAVLGELTVCDGLTTALTDTTGSGTWSSSNTGIGSVSSSGVVLGIAAGTTTIVFTSGTGCTASAIVTVNPNPDPIEGVMTVCVGFTTVLSDAGGGAWISSITSVATVGISSGIVTGGMAGTTVITYTLSTGCIITAVVTVNAAATPILGPTGICDGVLTPLSDLTGGGVWSSSAISVAAIGSITGVVGGVYPGTTTISYVVGTGCAATMVVTIYPMPTAIGGTAVGCVGSTFALSDGTGGGAWSSSNIAIADVDVSGDVTGAAAGTANITYTTGFGGVCFATIVVTIDAAPTAISGTPEVCVGSTTTLSDTITGGTWTSTAPAVATIGISTGIVNGNSEGTTTISYFLSTGCYSTINVTVNPLPSVISGSSSVCIGGTDTITGTAGGAWCCGGGVATITTGGVITGISAGTATFTYTATTGCDITFTVTVTATVAGITGLNNVCTDNSITLTDATTGGIWTSSDVSVAVVGSTTGIVTGVSAGSATATITYSVAGSCMSTFGITVNPNPPAITGPSDVCVGSTITLTDGATGGTWSSSLTGVATITSATGIVSGITGGTTNIMYELGTGCATSTTITVNALPAITAAAADNCGGTYSLTGSGAGTGGTYLWSPAASVSCATCTSPTATVSSTVTYTLTGTDINSCTNTDTVSVNGNRISGYMTMTTTPTDTLKVWLIQFSSFDSSLTAEDSAYSCMDGGTPYYEFDNEPSGNYMVKAMLLGSVPGTSGYIPTYGLSTAHWDTATNIIHASATDTQHINMIYGTVPTGPGFIGGLISSGAGRGTSSGTPVPGMLVYLEDGSGNLLTYTYTNTSGIYSFSGLAYGSYRVYPEAYQYHTTPWISITLSATDDDDTSASFYQNTTALTITPTHPLICCLPLMTTPSIITFPNPAVNELNINWTSQQTGNAGIVIRDITGREVYTSTLNIGVTNGSAQIDIHGIDNGIYFITIKSNSTSYTNKLLIGQ